MGSNKFDFNTASNLVQAVEAAASALEVKNGQMETRFGKLHDSFKDDAYTAFATDMDKADKAIGDVISQLRAVAAHIAKYAERLREEA